MIIAGTVILDVSNASMGGTGTNLTMTETSKLITGNAGLKPSPEGAYSLGGGTTIEFSGIGDLNPRVASISYYNVIISGTNVNITGTTDGLPSNQVVLLLLRMELCLLLKIQMVFWSYKYCNK